jgi:hypothetical protein
MITLRVRETSGNLGISIKHWGEAQDSIGMHLLHLGIDFLSYDNESTRAALNSGPPGVPGVAGADSIDFLVFFVFFEGGN